MVEETNTHRHLVLDLSMHNGGETHLRLGGESSAMPMGRKYAMAFSSSESLPFIAAASGKLNQRMRRTEGERGEEAVLVQCNALFLE